MYLGRPIEHGSRQEVFETPLHPYTRALQASSPSTDPRHRSRRLAVKGELPSPLAPPPAARSTRAVPSPTSAAAPRCPTPVLPRHHPPARLPRGRGRPPARSARDARHRVVPARHSGPDPGRSARRRVDMPAPPGTRIRWSDPPDRRRDRGGHPGAGMLAARDLRDNPLHARVPVPDHPADRQENGATLDHHRLRPGPRRRVGHSVGARLAGRARGARATAVAGNVPLTLTAKNARKVCSSRQGRSAGLRRLRGPAGAELVTAEYVHGKSGLDGPELPEPQMLAEAHAVDAIIDMLRTHPASTITLCPTGPLTNIATALQKAPDVVPQIQEIVLMGGGSAKATSRRRRVQHLRRPARRESGKVQPRCRW